MKSNAEMLEVERTGAIRADLIDARVSVLRQVNKAISHLEGAECNEAILDILWKFQSKCFAGGADEMRRIIRKRYHISRKIR